MIIIALLASFAAIYMLHEHGVISPSPVKKLASFACLIISGVLMSNEYGTLRSVFILMGLVSLWGTLFTLLRNKFQQTE